MLKEPYISVLRAQPGFPEVYEKEKNSRSPTRAIEKVIMKSSP